MRLLDAPQTWIAAAVVLLVIAIVLLLLARRGRRRTAAAAAQQDGSSRASYDAATDGSDPPTDPVDLRPAAQAGATQAGATQAGATDAEGAHLAAGPDPVAPAAVPDPAGEPAGTSGPGADRYGSAKDRLLAALLEDPQSAVTAVARIDAANGSGPPGGSVASLLRAGMTPAQVASLCGTRESALAEIVARDLGLLSTTSEPDRGSPSLAGAGGSTTPTMG